MANSINPTTPQLKAVKNFFDAGFTLDLNKLVPLTSKDYQFETFPKVAEHPVEAKEVHLKRYGVLFSMMTKLEATFHEVIEAPGKVVLHMTYLCSTIDGAELDYDSVAIITLVEEDGELKLASFKDFSDPEKRDRVHGWAAKVLAQKTT